VNVRLFAGAAAAANCKETTAEASNITDLREALSQAFGEQLTHVMSATSFLVNGTVTTDQGAALPESATVDILPPFAGG